MRFTLKLSGLTVYDGPPEEYKHVRFDFSSERIPLLFKIGTRHFVVVCSNIGELRHFMTAFNPDHADVEVDLRPMSFDYPDVECYSVLMRSLSHYHVEKITPHGLCGFLQYEQENPY